MEAYRLEYDYDFDKPVDGVDITDFIASYFENDLAVSHNFIFRRGKDVIDLAHWLEELARILRQAKKDIERDSDAPMRRCSFGIRYNFEDQDFTKALGARVYYVEDE